MKTWLNPPLTLKRPNHPILARARDYINLPALFIPHPITKTDTLSLLKIPLLGYIWILLSCLSKGEIQTLDVSAPPFSKPKTDHKMSPPRRKKKTLDQPMCVALPAAPCISIKTPQSCPLPIDPTTRTHFASCQNPEAKISWSLFPPLLLQNDRVDM